MKTLTKNYKNADEMIADGWTAADLADLTNCARSTPCAYDAVTKKFTWPLVDDCRVLYSCFTKQEKELYKAYRAGGNSGTGVTRASTSAVSEEQLEKANALLNKLIEINADAETMALAYVVLPHKVDSEMKTLLGVDNTQILKSTAKDQKFCNLRWMLNRKDDGAFLENHFPTLADISAAWEDETVAQVYRKTQVIALAARLWREEQFNLCDYVDDLIVEFDNL